MANLKLVFLFFLFFLWSMCQCKTQCLLNIVEPFVDGLLKYVTQSMSNIGNIDWYVHQYIAIHP